MEPAVVILALGAAVSVVALARSCAGQRMPLRAGDTAGASALGRLAVLGLSVGTVVVPPPLLARAHDRRPPAGAPCPDDPGPADPAVD